MKLALPQLMQPLEIHENKLTTLVVEDAKTFREIVSMLYDAQHGGEESLFLSRQGKSLSVLFLHRCK